MHALIAADAEADEFVLVDGPQHADLFGRPTPIKILVPLSEAPRRFRVRLSVSSRATIWVTACSKLEAEEKACNQVCWADVDDIDVDDVDGAQEDPE
jgi:hypothetical protein